MKEKTEFEISKNGTKLGILLIGVSLLFLYTAIVLQLATLERLGGFNSFALVLPSVILAVLGAILYFYFIPTEDKRKRTKGVHK